jgi:hypothetical protein
LALVLTFVGLKMVLEEPLRPYLESVGIDKTRLILLSLATIAAILTVTIVASIIAGPKPILHDIPQAVTEDAREVAADEQAQAPTPIDQGTT